MTQGSPTTGELVASHLRSACLDWDGKPMADEEEPRVILSCRVIREAADALTASQAEVERLREALKPFAEYAPFVRMFVQGRAAQGGSPMLPTKHFKLSDFERAETAIQVEESKP